METRRVVITGMGVVSPVGNDLETTWNNLINGVCGIAPIASFDTSDLPVKIAAELKDFDPIAAGVDKAFAKRNDRFAIYAMAAATQAMKDNEDMQMDPSRLGVYIGSGIGGFDTILREITKMNAEGPRWVSPLMIPTMIGNMASGSVAIRYNAQGPCVPIVTACATGTHSIGEAYRAIKHGYADAIITGGAEAGINRISIAGFANCKALTKAEDPLRASLPFNKNRGGFVIAEGAGIVLLEEYEHAKQRGAKIYAEVCGYGNSCDAYHSTAPRPDGTTQSLAIKQALDEAGYKAGESLYINAHGTGTPMNDSGETKAIKIAMGEEEARRAHISSTKSEMGHALGAAGGIELVATVMALNTGIIPPTIGLDEPDPECDLDYTPNKAVKVDLDIAISNSLGFGGHNACVAVRKVKDER
ncbi:MAG: beta-ketoacyl-ACP synthase II [Bacteroidales bacterium]|nr:beta-ketoacyl-ACP synthase II [Bacteroidales bacterium]